MNSEVLLDRGDASALSACNVPSDERYNRLSLCVREGYRSIFTGIRPKYQIITSTLFEIGKGVESLFCQEFKNHVST